MTVRVEMISVTASRNVYDYQLFLLVGLFRTNRAFSPSGKCVLTGVIFSRHFEFLRVFSLARLWKWSVELQERQGIALSWRLGASQGVSVHGGHTACTMPEASPECTNLRRITAAHFFFTITTSSVPSLRKLTCDRLAGGANPEKMAEQTCL